MARRTAHILVCLGLLIVAAHAGAAPMPTVDTGPPLIATKWVAVGFACVAALLGALLYVLPARAVAATRRQLESAVNDRVLTLQEEDRRRIARELHDGAGQALTAARLQLIALRESVAGKDEDVARIMGYVDEAIDEVRRSTTALAPPALAELGLARALQRHCASFAAAAKMTIERDLPADLPNLPAYVETTCYRIAQEALHNAARHGGATRAWLRLAVDSRELRLEVGDNGSGIADRSRRGFGLGSIEERARLAGGTLDVIDDAGPGPRIRVRLPAVEAKA